MISIPDSEIMMTSREHTYLIVILKRQRSLWCYAYCHRSFLEMAASQASDPMLAPQFLVLGHYFHENALLRLGKYHAYAFLSEIEEHALPYTRIAGFLKHGDFTKVHTLSKTR